MAPEQFFLTNSLTSKTVGIAKTLLVSKKKGTKVPLVFITRHQIFNDIANLGDCTDGSHMPGYLTDINGSHKEWANEMLSEVTVYPSTSCHKVNAYHRLCKTEDFLSGIIRIYSDQPSKFWGSYNHKSYSSVSCTGHIIGYSFQIMLWNRFPGT